MKKNIKFILIIAIIFSMCRGVSASDVKINRLKGIKDHEFKQKPYIVDSVSDDKLFMLPLRETMESLGYSVTWFRDGKIKVKKGLIRASLVVNKDEYRNRYDEKKNIYTTPVYNDGVCFVPNTFFTQVLNYDVFIIDDSVYMRNKIEGILSKNSLSIYKENEDTGLKTRRVEVVYPFFTNSQHLFINDILKDYIEKLKNEYYFEKINLMYDIAISNSKVVSIIFKGDIVTNEKSNYYFDSLNFDVSRNKQIELNDIIVDNKSSNKFLKEKIQVDEDKDIEINYLKMYIVKDAIVVYKNIERNKTIGKYFKLYELEHLSSQAGSFLFER